MLVNNGQEHRHNFGDQGEGFGHVMLLNIKTMIQPVSIGPGISHRGTDGTPLQVGIEEAHRQGGTAIWCHNNWGREDVPNFVGGKLDAQNIFDGGSHGSYEDSFYHYLNAGIRVPFSTGTDWFMYDLARVYTQVEGSLGIKSWLDALVAGRSFISNGPLLSLNIEGKDLGGTIELQSGREVSVEASASGRRRIRKLQLIQNGKVVSESEPHPKDGYIEARLDRSIKIDEPSWLAVRVSTQVNNEFGRQLFAHTSPIYIKVGGKAIRQREEVAYLVKQLEEAKQEIAPGRCSHPRRNERRSCLYMKRASGVCGNQEALSLSNVGGSKRRVTRTALVHQCDWVLAKRPARPTAHATLWPMAGQRL